MPSKPSGPTGICCNNMLPLLISLWEQVVVSSAFESPEGLQRLHYPLAAALNAAAEHTGRPSPYAHGLGTDR